ncbi:uncharacterized protein LOC126367541 [Pectinophora gossypiella]|uniref:uncharacterized protein LOC126367541 n=1 Tax=Pectinophora gossypiella TaxID=13191 RepID=UPI00214EA962|nr:uncharacterized protein LOC126367541 [Pectinophora gossypiella]
MEDTAAPSVTNIKNNGEVAQKHSKPRKRVRASSTSSSSSSSTSSSSSSSSSSSASHSKRKLKRRHNKKRGGKRGRRRDYRLDKLSQELSELRKRFTFRDGSSVQLSQNDVCSIDDNVSGDLYVEEPATILREPTCDDSFQPNIIFDIETKLKEPTVPKTPQNLLEILNNIQHFNSNEWSEVRYAEVQKLYNYSPGFVDLDVNDELKAYDSLKHLCYSDKSYAALTYCVLKQRETLQSALKYLLQWAQHSDLTFEGINEKINELFLKGDLFKVSSDLLQLICGHRAEVIQMRRDGIINHVRDPIHKAALRKIPPSCDHVFESDKLLSVLEKSGGVRKIFFPLNRQGPTVSASQAITSSNRPARLPSQGQAVRNVPSQGAISRGCSAQSHISYSYQPSQGCSHTRPLQGQRFHGNESRSTFASNARGSFGPRGGRSNNRGRGQDRNNRKHAGSQSDYNNIKKK